MRAGIFTGVASFGFGSVDGLHLFAFGGTLPRSVVVAESEGLGAGLTESEAGRFFPTLVEAVGGTYGLGNGENFDLATGLLPEAFVTACGVCFWDFETGITVTLEFDW